MCSFQTLNNRTASGGMMSHVVTWVLFRSDDFMFQISHLIGDGGEGAAYFFYDGISNNKAKQNKREIPTYCTYPSTVL